MASPNKRYEETRELTIRIPESLARELDSEIQDLQAQGRGFRFERGRPAVKPSKAALIGALLASRYWKRRLLIVDRMVDSKGRPMR